MPNRAMLARNLLANWEQEKVNFGALFSCIPRWICYVQVMGNNNNNATHFNFHSLAETPEEQRARFEREIERKLNSNAKVGI